MPKRGRKRTKKSKLPEGPRTDYEAKIAERVAQMRAKEEWTSGELAKRANIAQSTIAKIERYGYPCSMRSLYRLANAFGVTAHDILPAQSDDALESNFGPNS